MDYSKIDERCKTYLKFWNKYFPQCRRNPNRKTSVKLDNHEYVWLLHLDYKERWKYRNRFDYPYIYEEFLNENKKIYTPEKGTKYIFQVKEENRVKHITYLGAFIYDEEKSSSNCNVYRYDENEQRPDSIPFCYPKFDKNLERYVNTIGYDSRRIHSDRDDLYEGGYIGASDLNLSNYVFDAVKINVMRKMKQREQRIVPDFVKEIEELEEALYMESYYFIDDRISSQKEYILRASKKVSDAFIMYMKEER